MRNPIRLITAAAVMLAIAGLLFVGPGRGYAVTAEVAIKPPTVGESTDVEIRDLRSEVTLATGAEVVALADRDFGSLVKRYKVDVEPVPGQLSLAFTGMSSTAGAASEVANAYACAYIEVRSAIVREAISTAIEEARGEVARFDAELEDLANGQERETKLAGRLGWQNEIADLEVIRESGIVLFELTPAAASEAVQTRSRWMTGFLFAAIALAGQSIAAVRIQSVKPSPQP